MEDSTPISNLISATRTNTNSIALLAQGMAQLQEQILMLQLQIIQLQKNPGNPGNPGDPPILPGDEWKLQWKSLDTEPHKNHRFLVENASTATSLWNVTEAKWKKLNTFPMAALSVKVNILSVAQPLDAEKT